MKHLPTPPADVAEQRKIKPLGGYISDVLIDTQENVLRQVLAEKTAPELVETLFEIVHLPDLLDFFKDDMAHYLSTH